MLKNIQFFEDNKCGDVFGFLDQYLNYLKTKLNILKNELFNLNLIIHSPIIDLDIIKKIETKYQKIEKKINKIKSDIVELKTIMSDFILTQKDNAIILFSKILKFFTKKEEYEKCFYIKKIISLLY